MFGLFWRFELRVWISVMSVIVGFKPTLDMNKYHPSRYYWAQLLRQHSKIESLMFIKNNTITFLLTSCSWLSQYVVTPEQKHWVHPPGLLCCKSKKPSLQVSQSAPSTFSLPQTEIIWFFLLLHYIAELQNMFVPENQIFNRTFSHFQIWRTETCPVGCDFRWCMSKYTTSRNFCQNSWPIHMGFHSDLCFW